MRTDMWLEKFAKDNPLADETIRTDEREKTLKEFERVLFEALENEEILSKHNIYEWISEMKNK